MDVKTGIGQDSHRFYTESNKKPLILGGILFDGNGLEGNSDADVVLHAITNAISGITGINILGSIADEMCLKEKIIDSSKYLLKAIEYLNDYRISHVSISMECKVPKISSKIQDMKKSIATILKVDASSIGITATTGEGLTSFGEGKGIMVTAIVTAIKN